MLTSTKWRIMGLATAGAFTGWSEVEMAASAGGPNLCTGGTPTAVSTWDVTTPPSAAFNGVKNVRGWVANQNSRGAWIAYEFATAQTINEVRLWADFDSPSGLSPSIFAVESWDGAAWVTEWLGILQTRAANTQYTSTRPPDGAAHRYWGLINETCSTSSLEDMQLYGLEMAAEEDGPDIAEGNVTGYSYPVGDGAHTADQVFDGDHATTYYHANQNDQAVALWADFTTPTYVAEMRLYITSGSQARAPSHGWLAYSDDQISWAPVQRYDGLLYLGFDQKLLIGGTIDDDLPGLPPKPTPFGSCVTILSLSTPIPCNPNYTPTRNLNFPVSHPIPEVELYSINNIGNTGGVWAHNMYGDRLLYSVWADNLNMMIVFYFDIPAGDWRLTLQWQGYFCGSVGRETGQVRLRMCSSGEDYPCTDTTVAIRAVEGLNLYYLDYAWGGGCGLVNDSSGGGGFGGGGPFPNADLDPPPVSLYVDVEDGVDPFVAPLSETFPDPTP